MFHKRPRMLFCNILAIALAVGCISPQGAVSMATGTTEAKTDTTQTDDGSADASVAAVLNELNGRMPLTDASGNLAEPISWECGCMVRKCGACAMRINGVPRLACSVFLNTLKGTTVTLEPLSKFPLVKDLVVDRSILFENLKKIEGHIEEILKLAASCNLTRQDISDMTDILWEDTK